MTPPTTLLTGHCSTSHSMATKEDNQNLLSKDLHQVRGFRAGSRLSLDVEKLKEYGWKVNTRECTSSGSRRFTLVT